MEANRLSKTIRMRSSPVCPYFIIYVPGHLLTSFTQLSSYSCATTVIVFALLHSVALKRPLCKVKIHFALETISVCVQGFFLY